MPKQGSRHRAKNKPNVKAREKAQQTKPHTIEYTAYSRAKARYKTARGAWQAISRKHELLKDWIVGTGHSPKHWIFHVAEPS